MNFNQNRMIVLVQYEKMSAIRQNGFSLVELVTVIVLISVVGIVAFGRLGNLDSFDQKGFFNDTVAAMRYAQKLAVSTGCNVQVTLSAGGYQLFQQSTDCNNGIYTRPVLSPDRSGPYQGTAPSGVTIAPTGDYRFSPASSVSNISNDITIDVGSYQFRLYRFTGLVDVL